MKPIPFKIPKSEGTSLRVQLEEGVHFYDRLHYHPEFQITAIVKGHGVFYGGNNMIEFSDGDVFMIGENVPHVMKNSYMDFDKNPSKVYAVSLFFDQNSFGNGFFGIAELSSIKELLRLSKRGIKISGLFKKKIYRQIVRLENNKEDIIIKFLQILSDIDASEKVYINSEFYDLSIDERVGNRLNDILGYTFKHLHQTIKITDVAEVAHLSRSQFSRYFKLHTGKTYIEFLNELRIASACTMLLNEKNTIEKICYDVGFQNLSNFNRQFKKLKKTTPSEYRMIRVKP